MLTNKIRKRYNSKLEYVKKLKLSSTNREISQNIKTDNAKLNKWSTSDSKIEDVF